MHTLRWPTMVAGVWVAALIGVGAGASAVSARPVAALGCGAGTAAYPPPVCTTVAFGSSEFYPGGTVAFTVAGFTSGESVAIILHSRAITVGGATADAAGVLNASFTVPLDFPTGAHTLILQGAAGTVISQAFSVTVAPGSSAIGVSTAGTTGATTGGTTVSAAAHPSGALPFTGMDVVALGGTGLALVAGGGGLRVVARRRR